MKSVLAVTAVLEVGAGLALLVLPSMACAQLFGSAPDTPAGVTVARIAGAALVAIGLTCWFARHDVQSRAVRGLVSTLVLYNAVVLAVLVHAGLGLGLSSDGLWPAAFVHAVMAVWCAVSLSSSRK